MGRGPFGPRSTWPHPTSTCATRSSTGSSTPTIRAPAMRGASTPPTTSPTGSPTPSRESRTPSARWSSRTTDPSTTGSSRTSRCPSRPRQYEFARLNLTHTVLSKRVLLRLVNEGHVRGWDDPRMPTLSALRRRGFPAEGMRDFAAMIGVARADSVVEIEMLEHAMRNVLNRTAPRRFAVLDPLKVVIENYPEGKLEEMEAPNNPEDPSSGTRPVPFTRELWIERDDFMEDPPKKFFRLAPGREVRLRSAYFVTCREVVKDDDGRVVELRCTYDPETRGGSAPDGRRPKATLHWVSAERAVPAEVRLYGHLFASAYPGTDGRDLFDDVNPDSETTLTGCFVEPSLADPAIGETVQFERIGYFCADPDSAPGAPVFNRTLSLKDTWAKLQAQGRHDTA